MEVPVHDSTEICQGTTRTRTLLQIPSGLCLGGGLLLGLLLYLTGLSWWSLVLLLVASLVYAWARWQTKKDPQWPTVWWRHLQQAPVYRG